MTRVAIVGASGGIGAALLARLSQQSDISDIFATYNQSPAASSLGSIGSFGMHVNVQWNALDVTQEVDVAQWCESIGKIDWLINCVGYLHDPDSSPEKSIAQFSPAYFEKSMAVNCLPTLLLSKYAERALKSSEKGVFASISAKVGSITDNRLGGWYSYRASKAALNMALKCLSIEWQRSAPNVRVVALHPGTTDTPLSKPFQQHVPDDKLFATNKTADFLVQRLNELHDYPSGRFIAYDGEELPW